MWLAAISGVAVVLFGLWCLNALRSGRDTEMAKYAVLEARDGYEIRQYAPQLVAETLLSGDPASETRAAFSILAGYIFGANSAKTSIAMTAPVLMGKPELIAMTAPVTTATGGDGARRMAFAMPAQWTMATLPKPNDPRVTFRAVPARTMAALRYSWYMSPERNQAKAAELLALLQRDGITAQSEPVIAGYNPPFDPPFLMRNEVLVALPNR